MDANSIQIIQRGAFTKSTKIKGDNFNEKINTYNNFNIFDGLILMCQ